MKHRWAALLIVLAFSALVAGTVVGQAGRTPPTGSQRMAGSLGQNYPNPFNPETTIPFLIGMEGTPPVCTNSTQQHRVSLKVYDAIMRLVAIPIIQGGDVPGQPLTNVVLSCGDYKAYWDGLRMGTRQKVPSGPYIYVLEVDGKLAVKRMFVAK